VPETTLTQGEIFDLLSNARRRYVLYNLSRRDEPITIGDLADEVAAWENDTEVSEVERQERKRVYVSLYQTHVPKLADAGLLAYDEESGTVAITERVDELTPYLEDGEEGPPWHLYYLVAGVAGALLYAASALDAPLLGALPSTAVGAVVFLTFLAITAAYYGHKRRARRRLPAELIRK
jgi:hypothetical protein